MTATLDFADILFMFDQVNAGNTPAPGDDPLAPIGIRTADGTFNNITGLTLADQFNNIVNTATFGNTNENFVSWSNSTSALAYAPTGNVMTDGSERLVSNLIADITASNPATVGADLLTLGDASVDRLPENSLFTFFGQFFDHGLDFISKQGNGTILIPIDPADMPGVNPAFPFIPVTRAELDPVTGDTINTTAPFVEQSQTYGSTAATAFYLMEYDAMTGEPTGDLVHGANGGMGTWADIKANANVWARAQPGANPAVVMLTDDHVLDIPNPDLWNVAAGQFIEPAPGAGVGTGQAFIADIAHFAVPVFDGLGALAPDADGVINPHGFGQADPDANTYDDELLDAHYVSGDPRVNENSALTSIHQAFHGEHTRIVNQIKDWVQQQNQIDPTFAAQWTGDMFFEAAKLANEMQYQHLVFEEFGRRMSPNIDAFASYDININPNITAEFSQAVYRLGHSQLTDNVKTTNVLGNDTDVSLIDAFLDPQTFDKYGSGDFLKGGQLEQGARIDEFVADGLRNFLVGLPLDLAAINIARGRDLGLPSLNQLRADLFAQTGGESSVRPYDHWNDFGINLLNPASLVNFIAAYGIDAGGALVAARATGDNAQMRAAAQTLMGDNAFMTGAAATTGLDNIDLWIGGLAEKKVPLGLLGSTFDFVFTQQMISLQDGDRFYYLARIGGNLLDEIEGQTLADLMMRSGDAVHLNGDVFGTPDALIEMGAAAMVNFLKTPAELTAYVAEIIAGTHANNVIYSGAGNDQIYGEGGNDTLFGGENDDHIYGGSGNDVIWGDVGFDLMRGDAGNDEIHGGADDDAIFGNEGNDMLFGDAGFDALAGGAGNDTIRGGSQDDEILGGEGDDLMFGDSGADGMDGGDGNDVMFGGFGGDGLAGGAGDDMLFGGSGADALDGGVGGYDIANYENWLAGAPTGVGLVINMLNPGLSTGDAMGDSYLDIEEIRGTTWNDVITGDDVGHVLNGNSGNDTIIGGLLDDTFIGGTGNDRLIGGGGVDEALFIGAEANFTITLGIGGSIVVNDTVGTGGQDTLTGVSWLVFDDALLNTTNFQYAPLVNLSGTQERVQNGSTIIGELELTVDFVDGAAVPGVGTVVGNIEIADPDGAINGPRVLAVAGPDAAVFDIVPNGAVQQLVFIGGGAGSFVNYEAKKFYNVTVTATDNLGGSAVNITINVDDRNDNAPVVTSVSRVNVGEGVATAAIVYLANASDIDTTGEAITFALGGPDAAAFNMTPTGELTFAASPVFGAPTDVGGDNVYNVTITASDGPNMSEAKQLAIHVTGNPIVFNEIVGTAGNDTLSGTSGSDHITGLGAIDELYGLGAPDWLEGGPGDDLLIGGLGGDILDGGAGTDQARYAASTAVNINLGAGTASGGEAEGDVLIGIENLAGSQFADILIGDDGVNELRGLGGNDFIQGGLGADLIFGELGFDTASYADSAVGVDIGMFRVGTGGTAQGDVLNGIEVIVGSSFNDTLVGTGAYSPIRLEGGDGNDLLFDYGGTAQMFGGAGNDTMIGRLGPDTFDGGTGVDVVRYADAIAAVNVNLATGLGSGAAGTDAVGDTYVNVENVVGSAFADILVGDGNANNLRGGNAGDRITGGGGMDQMFGEAGIDTFVFNALDWGDDLIFDFDAIPNLEKLDFTGLGLTFGSFNIVDTAFGLRIDLADITAADGTSSIALANVEVVDLTADDFIF